VRRKELWCAAAQRTWKKRRKEESDAENADIAAPTRVWRAGGRGQAALESGARRSEGACWIVAVICKMRRGEAAEQPSTTYVWGTHVCECQAASDA
jgi:hypothetical protein